MDLESGTPSSGRFSGGVGAECKPIRPKYQSTRQSFLFYYPKSVPARRGKRLFVLLLQQGHTNPLDWCTAAGGAEANLDGESKAVLF
jgi:hypothetical protein